MMICRAGLLTRGSGYLDHRSRPARDQVRISGRVACCQQVGVADLEPRLRGVAPGALPDLVMRVHVALDESQDPEAVQPVRLWRSAVHPRMGTRDLGLEHGIAVVGQRREFVRGQCLRARRYGVMVTGDVTEVVMSLVLLLLEGVLCRLGSVVRVLVTVQVTHRQPQNEAEDHAPRHHTVGHEESVCGVAASDHRTNRAY
jgi:hypothetical protein